MGLGTIAVAAAGLRLGALAAGFAPLLAGLANPAVLAVAAAGAAISGGAYLARVRSESERAKEALDQVRAVCNEVMAQQQVIETGISGLDDQLGLLLERREKLNAGPMLRRNTILEAQKAFGDLGLSISASASSIDELIAAYRRLRTEFQGQNTELLQRQFAVTTKELDALVTKGRVDQRGADQRITDALGSEPRQALDAEGAVVPLPERQSDDAALRGAGLPASLKPLLNVIRNPSSLGGDDPLGVSRYQQMILDQHQRSEREAAPLRLDASDPRRLADFVAAYNFARRLKTLRGLTPYEAICKAWVDEPSRFTQNPHHQIPGPNRSDQKKTATAKPHPAGDVKAVAQRHGAIEADLSSDNLESIRRMPER